MSYLLDACVVAEALRTRPDPDLLAWLRSVEDDSLHMSALSAGELRASVERLPGSAARRERRLAWLEGELSRWFGDRLLPVTPAIAQRWGALSAVSGHAPAVEALLAATALVHGLRLVTKGGRAFRKYPGLQVLSPWARG